MFGFKTITVTMLRVVIAQAPSGRLRSLPLGVGNLNYSELEGNVSSFGLRYVRFLTQPNLLYFARLISIDPHLLTVTF